VTFLLDTHLVLWASGRPDRLPAAAPDLLNDPAHVLVFSVVSIWETAIKHALKRDDFDNEPAQLRHGLLDRGYIELPITGPHAAAVAALPLIHRDPFDRLLVAQATVERITLLTADPVLARYPGPVRLIA
jgi:PIN domain nuclease of toxin-antitoxin system